MKRRISNFGRKAAYLLLIWVLTACARTDSARTDSACTGSAGEDPAGPQQTAVEGPISEEVPEMQADPALPAASEAPEIGIPAALQTEGSAPLTEPSSQAEPSSPVESASPAEPAPLIREFDITLGFAGDINLDDHWCNMIYYHTHAKDLSDVIEEAYLEQMRNADILWVNNEFTFSTRGEPTPGKSFHFRADPGNVSILQEMGADIVGLANNHVYDYGPDALEDTLQTLTDAGISYVGAGRDLEEAMRPVILEVDGVRIAYVAASRAEKNRKTPQATEDSPGVLLCYDTELFLDAIREADAQADYVIALPHWGTEYSTVLETEQTEGAKAFLEAGADAVIGTHPHILQAVCEIEGKPVVYSLGNFWFNEKKLMTMLAELHLTGQIQESASGETKVLSLEAQLELWPGWQEGYRTRMAADEEERAELLKQIEELGK